MQQKLSSILPQVAAEDVHQRGLAGPVLPHKAQRVPRCDRQTDSLEHRNAEEALVDVVKLDAITHVPAILMRRASSTAASRMTPPFTIMMVNCERFSRLRLLSISVRNNTPQIVQTTLPRPP